MFCGGGGGGAVASRGVPESCRVYGIRGWLRLPWANYSWQSYREAVISYVLGAGCGGGEWVVVIYGVLPLGCLRDASACAMLVYGSIRWGRGGVYGYIF